MAKVLDCGFKLSEFKPQSQCYVHFQTNTLEKGMNSLISLAMGWIVLLLFCKDGFGFKKIMKVDMPLKQWNKTIRKAYKSKFSVD